MELYLRCQTAARLYVLLRQQRARRALNPTQDEKYFWGNLCFVRLCGELWVHL